MSSRLRSLNSTRVSFFAFQDIITCVSGILILVTLLLATELDRPAPSTGHEADPRLERELGETLRRQVQVDAGNRSLQGLLAEAETAPAAEKLESDLARLRAELAEDTKRHASVAAQLAASQSALEARDRTLGLTGLKEQIQQVIQDADSVARQQAGVRAEMAALDARVAGVQSKLLKLREREGKVWLIPDKASTTKEPILVTVGRTGAKMERFDQPGKAKEFGRSSARAGLESLLGQAKSGDQYVVFLVRPSGIDLFQDLAQLTRGKGFEVGFDALEEDREVHFTTPPSLDEPAESKPPADTRPGEEPTPATAAKSPQTNATATAAPIPVQQPTVSSPPGNPPKPKSWWRRFLEWVGLA